MAYFLLTRGEAGIDTMEPQEAARVREAEERESARRVGVETVEFADWHDGAIEYGVPLRREIAAAVRRHQPDLVIGSNWETLFGPGMVNQADHRAVGLATLDAVADAGNRWLHRDLLDEGLEPWNGVTVYASPVPPAPRTSSTCPVHTSRRRCTPSRRTTPTTTPSRMSSRKPRALLQMILGRGGEAAGIEHALALEVVFDRRQPPPW